ncbi:class I SAM-dependent methyltransferase [Clostridia bacterium OttesenSCG-928-F22]|nr:class I SAM-dependent methyltransferase [Clostridia bacterium OttesenSCG-928-F22]
MLLPHWENYEILDAGDGEKLERWGDVILLRPDPQAIWPKLGVSTPPHAHYHRSNKGGGAWEFTKGIASQWQIEYHGLRFLIKPTGFKHTGLFPEQAVNWDYMVQKLSSSPGARVLNLFGYTGGATLACASAGASVTHVDSAKGIVSWCKENLRINGLEDAPVRYIVDDAFKFVQREIRRGKQYDAIIMDPPSYGRGPTGEMWKLEEGLYPLIQSCKQLLSSTPLFVLINAYTTGLSPQILRNILHMAFASERGGSITADTLGLPIADGKLILPCGITGRWEA